MGEGDPDADVEGACEQRYPRSDRSLIGHRRQARLNTPMTAPSHGPTSHSFISQRLRLHYVDWGNENAPPLILLHGGRDHCRNWDWVAQRLRNDYHIIAPDLRGHGDSAYAPSGGDCGAGTRNAGATARTFRATARCATPSGRGCAPAVGGAAQAHHAADAHMHTQRPSAAS